MKHRRRTVTVVALGLVVAASAALLWQSQSARFGVPRTPQPGGAIEAEAASLSHTSVPAQADGGQLDRDSGLDASADRTAANAAESQVTTPVLLRGRVVFEDGRPAIGARVHARTGGWYSVMPGEIAGAGVPRDGRVAVSTDDDGVFRFEDGLTPGESLSIVVTADGYATYRRRRIDWRTTPLDVGTIRMRDGFAVVGQLIDSGGQPIAGVDVLMAASRGVAGQEGRFRGEGRPVARSEPDGRFRVRGVTPGPWHLLFDAAGRQVVQRSGEQRVQAVVDLGAVTIPRGITVAGRIVGLPSAEPVDVWVEVRAVDSKDSAACRPRRARPQADGGFRIEGVPPGERLRVRVVARDPELGFVPVPEVAPILEPAGDDARAVAARAQDRQSIELTWGETLALRARMVDSSGAAIERYRAMIALGYFGGAHPIGAASEERHPDGVLRAEGMRLYSEEATPRLIVEATGFERLEREVRDLIPGTTVDVGDLVLSAAPVLRVRVQDSGGAPIASAMVELRSNVGGSREVRSASTDANGVARLNAMTQASSTLRVSHPLRATSERVLQPEDRAEQRISVVLAPGCELAVRVMDPSGAAAPGEAVVIRPLLANLQEDPARSKRRGTTDLTGIARWRDLKRGKWAVHRERSPREWRDASSGDLSDAMIVTLTSETVQRITLQGVAVSDVRGSIRDAIGALPTATLRLMPDDHRGGRVSGRDGWRTRYNRLTDSAGGFVFERIAHGNYILDIEHDSRTLVAKVPVTVPLEEEQLRVVLQDTAIVTRLVDAAGLPVSGVEAVVRDATTRTFDWNDARTAWVDERGELKQAWDQTRLNGRISGPSGKVRFPGLIPARDLEVGVDLGDYVAAWSRVPALRPGETRRVEDVTVYRTGALELELAGGTVAYDLQIRIDDDAALASEDGEQPALWRSCPAGEPPPRWTHVAQGPVKIEIGRAPTLADADWSPLVSTVIDLHHGMKARVRVNLDDGTAALQ